MKNDNQKADKSKRFTRFPMTGVIVNTKIRFKILSLVIIVCAFSLLSMSVASIVTFKNISDYSININKALGNDATKGASHALVEQAYNFLQVIAREQANSCNSILDSIKFNVNIIDAVVRDIISNPENYNNDRPIFTPSEAVDGVYYSTYSLPASVPATEEIMAEIDLMSNLSLIMPVIAEDPNIIELYVGFESGLFYNYTTLTFYNPEYDPRARPWYTDALNNPEDVIFTDVYEDAFGTGMVLTSAKAVIDDDGEIIGVAAIDIQLDSMKKLILDTRLTGSGYAFILDKTGRYIVHPDLGDEGFEPFLTESDQSPNNGLAEGYGRMMNGESGIFAGEMNGKRVFLTFTPISVAGWSLGVMVYEEEILSSLENLNNKMTSLANDSEKNILSMSGNAMFIFILIFLFVVIMVIALSLSLTNIISKPIQKLAQEVTKIGDGEFEYRIPVETRDEIGALTKAFNDMADNLYSYAQNVVSLNHVKSELEVAANTDMLTGVFNRRHFMEIASLLDKNEAFIAMFDLDHFKKVNDTYGHPAGDQVLREVAAIVKNSIRPNDLFARYGGEEFILLVNNSSKEGVQKLINRIMENICKAAIEYEDTRICITTSIGIAKVTSEHDMNEIISFADEALYVAKNEGRNRAVFFEDNMHGQNR